MNTIFHFCHTVLLGFNVCSHHLHITVCHSTQQLLHLSIKQTQTVLVTMATARAADRNVLSCLCLSIKNAEKLWKRFP